MAVLSNRLLDVHRTVVRVGTLTAAAEELGFTVSAVSQQLSTLESQAGLSLYERVGRGVRPTDAGRLLAERAAVILDEVARTEADLADLRSGRSGRVRVLTFHSAGETLLPQAIAAIRSTRPDVRVIPGVDEAPGALRRLRAGEVELIIAVEPHTPGHAPDDGLFRRHLLTDPYRLLLPSDHPLAARTRPVPVKSLADEPWIVTTGPDDYLWTTLLAHTGQAGFTPVIGAQTDEFPVTQGYVAAGLGVAMAPRLASGVLRPGVVELRLAPEPPAREIWLATRPALLESPAVVELGLALRRAAASVISGWERQGAE